ncbi:hypothetical protein ARMSODRAFT_1018083 [Armillaria solidipes]|uniref:Uncharacterized protein n=1 Tax=Armillaria solidipes TaxID=1076256 RepID=A0A2H3BNR1_9AGAR|nr:hypothetical protein ARMSODRAFT_1018083 [Armillaria solidipes]
MAESEPPTSSILASYYQDYTPSSISSAKCYLRPSDGAFSEKVLMIPEISTRRWSPRRGSLYWIKNMVFLPSGYQEANGRGMGCIRDMMIIDHRYVTQAETAGLQRKLSPPGDLHTNTGSSTFRSPFLPLPPALVQAKALWARDIITIVEETNADWWLGEYNGCKALFPVNYVEKIVPAAYDPGRSVPPAPTEKKAYKPFMTAHPNANAPPPGNISVGLQQDLGRGTSLAEVAVTGMVAVRYRLASYDDDEELCASTTVSIAALDNTHDPLKYRKEDIALGDDFHCSLHGVKGLLLPKTGNIMTTNDLPSYPPTDNGVLHVRNRP